MNKHLIIFGVAILLLAVGLSGCEEITENFTGDSNKYVEFSDYSVTTEWGTYGNPIIKDGFNHDFPENEMVDYYIRGKVRNIADKPIDTVSITTKFYDAEDNYLDSSSTNVFNLYLNESKSFTIKAHNNWAISMNPDYCEYFEYVDHYTIEYSVDLH